MPHELVEMVFGQTRVDPVVLQKSYLGGKDGSRDETNAQKPIDILEVQWLRLAFMQGGDSVLPQ